MDWEKRGNAEGYPDPTACDAIENIESRERAKELIQEIFRLCASKGFDVVDRIKICDRRTGRMYK